MASITVRALVWGAAGLLGAGLGALTAAWWPRPDVDELIRAAARLESGRYVDLGAVAAADGQDSPLALGLKAEARARLWSSFERGDETLAEARKALAAVPQRWSDAVWLAHALTSSAGAAGAPPATPKGRVAKALLLERAGQPEAALIELVGAARDEPRRRNTQLALARMHMRRGAWAAARDVLDVLADERPDDPIVWALAGRVRVRLKERVRAEPRFAPLPAAERRLVATTRALVAAAAGRRAAAADAIAEVDGQAPHRAALLLWAGRAQDAEAIYAELGDRLGVARSRFTWRLEKCAELRPGQVVVQGEAQPLGQLQAAVWPHVRFVPSPNVYPEHLYRLAEGPRALGAANRVGLARMCLEAGDARRASEYLERAARIEGALVRPELRARALLEADRARSALAVLVEVPEAERTPMQHLWLARALRARERLDDAFEVLSPIGRSDEVIAPAVSRLMATLEVELGRSPDSLARLLEIAPKDVGGRLLAALGTPEPPQVSAGEVVDFMDGPGWSDLPAKAQIAGALQLWAVQPKRAERVLRGIADRGELEATRVLGERLVELEARRGEGRALLESWLEQAEEGPQLEAVRALLVE